MDDYGLTATYSPDDNKLRLYALERLDDETYQRIRAAGFRWAPKQELFVAPRWTPEREDVLLDLCGEIGDEDQSKEERSADRAERFAGYRDKRRAEAGGHADTFEAGPSAFGHQNAQRAERQAARHDRYRHNAVSQWSKAEYWQERTAAVIAHALHKASPRVRRGRILKLEADQRRWGHLSERWNAHFNLRLEYERAMLENEGGSAAEADMVVGGFIGGHQIHKINRSPVTGRVVSVGVYGKHPWRTNKDGTPEYGVQCINIERMGSKAYRAPTDDELKAFEAEQKQRKAKAKAKRKAHPKPKLINPTEADAQRLQDIWNKGAEKPSEVWTMTQAQYSAASRGTYSHFETSEIVCTGKQPRRRWGKNYDMAPVMFKVRKSSGSGWGSADRVIVITDKPQKPLPWDDMRAEYDKLPTFENMAPQIAEIAEAFAKYNNFTTSREESNAVNEIISRAEYAGIVQTHGASRVDWTERGMNELARPYFESQKAVTA